MSLITPYEHIKEIVHDLSKEILNYTPQLYRKFDNKQPIRPKPIATSVLIKSEDKRFLVTAGHVLRENNADIDPEDIGVMVDDEFIILNGKLNFVNPDASNSNDQTDLAVFELNFYVADHIEKKYFFLPTSTIDINHNLSDDYKYLIVGYPTTKTILKIKASIYEVNPFIFLTKISKEGKYRQLGFNSYSNIVLDYIKSKIKSFGSDLVLTGPDTYGVSGSGLWYIDSFIKPNEAYKAKLVGIMIEWRKRESVVIGTRIHLLTEILRQICGLNLTKSEIANVNFDHKND